MSLNYSSVASDMSDFYITLKTDYVPKSSNGRKNYPKNPSDKWVEKFMSVYDNDSISGTMSKSSVVLISNKPLLKFSPPGCNLMGTVIANYWSSQITPGSPAVCGGSVSSVTNDAAKIGPAINGYMCGLPGNIESKPYYNALFNFIETQVKSIIWTVTETGSNNNPCTYSVTVS